MGQILLRCLLKARAVPRAAIGMYFAFGLAFVCFWKAADVQTAHPFTDPHWRLLAAALLGTGLYLGHRALTGPRRE